MSFDDYHEIYQNMIRSWNARLFYESANTLEHHCKKIEKIKTKTAKEFYDLAIIITNNESNKIITETHEDVQFSKALINKIFNVNDFTQLQAFEVFSRCSKHIQSSYTIKNDVPLYIFNFSFSNNAKMICSIFSSFDISYTLKNGSLKEKQEYESKLFKEKYEYSYGLFVNQDSCAFIILNKDVVNETAIKHELHHYLQLILKKDDGSQEIKSKFNDIAELQFSKDEQEYLFDKWEFATHIKVNLISFLDEMYWKFYKKQNWTKKRFIEKFIETVEKDPLNVVSNFISKIFHMKNQDTTSLRLFAACFIIKDKQYLIDAIRWLKEAFK